MTKLQPVTNKVEEFFDNYRIVTYEKGQILTMANEDPKYVTFIVDGTVEQYDITPDGNRLTVNMFRQGAFFPMSWAMNDVPNNYFFSALTDLTTRLAPRDDTLAFLKANPDVLYDLLSRVYKGADSLLRRLSLAASGVASNRLAFELILEAYRFGDKLQDGMYRITISQQALASRCGLARETVSRELHKLQRDGFLQLADRAILIDPDKIEEKLQMTI